MYVCLAHTAGDGETLYLCISSEGILLAVGGETRLQLSPGGLAWAL